MKKQLILGTLLLVVLCGGAMPASAQGFRPGVRAGASVDPDQFYFGAHIESPAIVNRVHLRPNVEIGFGDDATLVAVNVEAVYKYPLRQSPWVVYGGGGPAINFYNFDDDQPSDTRGGFNFLGGLEHDNGVFFEVKVEAGESPDLKFAIGYNFR